MKLEDPGGPFTHVAGKQQVRKPPGMSVRVIPGGSAKSGPDQAGSGGRQLQVLRAEAVTGAASAVGGLGLTWEVSRADSGTASSPAGAQEGLCGVGAPKVCWADVPTVEPVGRMEVPEGTRGRPP